MVHCTVKRPEPDLKPGGGWGAAEEEEEEAIKAAGGEGGVARTEFTLSGRSMQAPCFSKSGIHVVWQVCAGAVL